MLTLGVLLAALIMAHLFVQAMLRLRPSKVRVRMNDYIDRG